MMKTELKTQFVKLYESIDKTIERLAKVDHLDQFTKPINFVTKKLIDLKENLKTALISNFDTKSYMENKIILQRHMAIYTYLTEIIEELGKAKDKKK